jgi:hypothetical protein
MRASCFILNTDTSQWHSWEFHTAQERALSGGSSFSDALCFGHGLNCLVFFFLERRRRTVRHFIKIKKRVQGSETQHTSNIRIETHHLMIKDNQKPLSPMLQQAAT